MTGPKRGDSASKIFTTTGRATDMSPDIVDGSFEYGTATVEPSQRQYLNMYLAQVAAGIRVFVSVVHIMQVEVFDRYTPN